MDCMQICRIGNSSSFPSTKPLEENCKQISRELRNYKGIIFNRIGDSIIYSFDLAPATIGILEDSQASLAKTLKLEPNEGCNLRTETDDFLVACILLSSKSIDVFATGSCKSRIPLKPGKVRVFMREAAFTVVNTTSNTARVLFYHFTPWISR